MIFSFWTLVFFFFPRFTNEFAGIGNAGKHADDWTQIAGLFSLAFAVVLNEAHLTLNSDVRRIVARGVLAFTLPCAALMTYWQIIPDRRWFRLDILNIVLLYLMSIGLFLQSDLWKPLRPMPSRR